MKRFIFLDIDGVLTTCGFVHINGSYLDDNKCMLINKLCDDTNAKIVISSSWGYCDDTIEKLKKHGLNTDNVIDGTVHLEHGRDYLCRGNSIAKWLSEHVKWNDDYEYVIFDDDTDMLLSQIDNFIHTDGENGLTEDDIKKATEILLKENNGKHKSLTFYRGNKF